MKQLNSVGQRNFIVTVVCFFLSSLFVALRVWCKLWYRNGLHADDYWMFITLLGGFGAGAVEIWGNVTGGHGRKINEIFMDSVAKKNMKMLENYLLSLYLAWMLYLISAYAVKMSVLLFYRRIFPQRVYQHVTVVVMVAATLWVVIALAIELAVCIPLDGFWHPLKKAKCMNSNTYDLGVNIVDVILDSVIVALPIRMVFTLQSPMRTKIGFAGIFSVAGVVVVTNLLRIVFMYQPNAIYANYEEALLWSSLHIMTAHLCACLPIYKPLWQAIAVLWIKMTSRFSATFKSIRKPRVNQQPAQPQHADEKVVKLGVLDSVSTSPTLTSTVKWNSIQASSAAESSVGAMDQNNMSEAGERPNIQERMMGRGRNLATV